MKKRDYAKRLLVHYMNFTWEKIGLKVDYDNIAEWEDIVDALIDAAKEEMVEEMERNG